MKPAEVRRRILAEHRKLRAMLDALVPLAQLTSRLRDSPYPTLLVAREVRNFAEYLQNDMAHEEATLLSAAALPDAP